MTIDIYCDFDHPILYFHREERIEKSRKVHNCRYCRRPIEVGRPKLKQVFMTDNDQKPVTEYFHIACDPRREEPEYEHDPIYSFGAYLDK